MTIPKEITESMKTLLDVDSVTVDKVNSFLEILYTFPQEFWGPALLRLLTLNPELFYKSFPYGDLIINEKEETKPMRLDDRVMLLL